MRRTTMAFAEGDLVTAKSGGPLMDVELVGAQHVRCGWFVGTQRHSGNFAPAGITKAAASTTQDFKRGDLVVQKSGGPEMTIQRITRWSMDCSWFIGTDRQCGEFSPEELTKLPDGGRSVYDKETKSWRVVSPRSTRSTPTRMGATLK
jgi:uncharacterized protein YodC (DUF2158 family)